MTSAEAIRDASDTHQQTEHTPDSTTIRALINAVEVLIDEVEELRERVRLMGDS